MLLPSSWRWLITLDSDIQSSPDTLRVLITGFASMIWNKTSVFTVLGLPNIARSSRFLETWVKLLEPFDYCPVIKCAFTFRTTNVFRCFWSVVTEFESAKHDYELDYVACSSFQHSNQTRREAMHNVSAHQVTRCYQSQMESFHGFNCYGHVIYSPQANTYQPNIAKLLTHSSRF